MLRLLAIGVSVLAGGCASRLVVTGQANQRLSGVPVRAPVLAEVTRVISYAPLPNVGEHASVCKDERITTLEVLPLGRPYHVTFQPALFGKTEFKLDLGDSGALKTVSLNSDARAPEALKEAGAVLGTVLPFIAAKKESPSVASEPAAQTEGPSSRDKHCVRTDTRVDRIAEALIARPPSF